MDRFLFIKSMLDYIENRVAEEISQDDIAAAAGFSLPHFRAVFRDATGRTLARYVAYRRLCHAASELARTDRAVADIAMTYCFGSHDVFIRAFKRAFGETPTEFRRKRRTVGRTLIAPGIYGPSVQLEKEQSSMLTLEEDTFVSEKNGDMRKKDQETLYGVVPRVNYFGREGECTPFVSCLRACLTYLGREIGYARLMAGSGAAFRLMWNPECWDGSNVDILCMRADATEPLRRAFGAAGREFRLLCKPGKEGHYLYGASDTKAGNKEAFIELIRNEIGEGRPVIGFGIIGPPEACIIAGYRDSGETLLGWNFFQDMPEFAGDAGKEPCGYFNRKGWYEHPETIALATLGEEIPLPDEKAFLKETLAYALSIMETPKVHGRAGGHAAYEAWAGALMDEGAFPKDAPLPLLMERLMCQIDAMTMVSEGRWFAHAFLEQEAGLFPEMAEMLKAASEMFRQEHQLVMEMGGVLEGPEMGERCAGVLARPEIRKMLAVMIKKCAEHDKKAAEYIRKAIPLLDYR